MAAETPTIVSSTVRGPMQLASMPRYVRCGTVDIRPSGSAIRSAISLADAAYLAEFLRTLSGPIVLVGHSYGGNVISTAAIGNEQVKALVYLNGWLCDVGESQQQLAREVRGQPCGAFDQARSVHQSRRERRHRPLPRTRGVPRSLRRRRRS